MLGFKPRALGILDKGLRGVEKVLAWIGTVRAHVLIHTTWRKPASRTQCDTRSRREQLPHPDATLMVRALIVPSWAHTLQLSSVLTAEMTYSDCLLVFPSIHLSSAGCGPALCPWIQLYSSPLSCSQQIPQQQLQPLTDLLRACDLTPTDYQPFCQLPSWESLLPSPFVATLCGI